jgi:Starch-binding associating with outer membrane
MYKSNYMKIKISNIILGLVAISFGITGCQKGDLLSNTNVAAESSTIPSSLILNHITANLMKEEDPIVSNVWKYNQNVVSNYTYYFGSNAYNWSTTSTTYDNIKYCVKMEEQAFNQYKNKTNVYFALSKFFKAYSYIWLTQRVGDIPMSQSNDINNLTPKYDTQHDVYKQSLALLDSANLQIAALISASNANTKVDAGGDVFGLTYAQWQKAINTYKLRVLISLSKRADDNADLNIKSQFATIVNNPTQYPIMTSNSDNVKFVYNSAYNQYPPQRYGYAQYNTCLNISKTWIGATVPNKDPRVLALLSPGVLSIDANNPVGSFTTYVGQEQDSAISSMKFTFTNSTPLAALNYNRYMTSTNIGGTLSEPYILLGYSEMCFNIAEAANRGWITTQSASAWYTKGVQASLDWYGIKQGGTITIGNNDGTKPSLGTATYDVNTFLTNIAYAGDNATGLTQILSQKYVSFFLNSGFESYYQWRRTGIPAFKEGGSGIGTPSFKIPLRWQYPVDETNYNPTNNKAALSSQYGGTDDLTAKMWLIK